MRKLKMASLILGFSVYSLVLYMGAFILGSRTSHNRMVWKQLQDSPLYGDEPSQVRAYEDARKPFALRTPGDTKLDDYLIKY